MTNLELKALTRAIRLKVALLDRVRAVPPSTWPQCVRGFLSDLAAIDLRDERVRFVLLATLIEELRAVVRSQREAATLSPSAEHFLLAGAGVADLAAFCAQPQECREPPSTAARAAAPADGASVRTSSIARLIDQRYMDRLTLDSLAASVHEPRGRMATAFRQEMGTTIHGYLTRVRIARAADRLLVGEKVEAVMLAVGYRSKRSFYRQFRALTGVAPGAYRSAPRALVTSAATREESRPDPGRARSDRCARALPESA